MHRHPYYTSQTNKYIKLKPSSFTNPPNNLCIKGI